MAPLFLFTTRTVSFTWVLTLRSCSSVRHSATAMSFAQVVFRIHTAAGTGTNIFAKIMRRGKDGILITWGWRNSLRASIQTLTSSIVFLVLAGIPFSQRRRVECVCCKLCLHSHFENRSNKLFAWHIMPLSDRIVRKKIQMGSHLE